jgi:hypothetical protein
MRFERNIKVVVAWQTIARGVAEHPTDDGSQRFLNQKIVSNVIYRHGRYALAPLVQKLSECVDLGNCGIGG